mgnify:FL=1
MLETLKGKDKTLAVATGKARQGLDRLMKVSETTRFFKASRCSDEANSKPDPEMLFQLLTNTL